MTHVSLAAPTGTYIGGITAALGLIGAGTTYGSGETYFTAAGNNGLLLVQVVVGSSGTGTLQFTCPNSANNPAAITVADSDTYLFGPFDPAVYNWPVGSTYPQLVYATLPGASGTSVASFYMNASAPLVSYRGTHNPFDTAAGDPQD